MKTKKLWIFFPIILFFGIIIFFESKSYFERKHFFERKLNTLVFKKKGNWSGGRSYDYLTKNKIVITLIKSDSIILELGDSIVKKANSWDFEIYKSDITGQYRFHKIYNLKNH